MSQEAPTQQSQEAPTQQTQTPDPATALTGKTFTVHLLNEASGGQQAEVLDALPALGLLRLHFVGRTTASVAWVPLTQITSLYEAAAPAAGPFADAAEIDFNASNMGVAAGAAAVGDVRHFKFRVTAPGYVGIFLNHSSSGFDDGPITLYDADYAPLPAAGSGPGFWGPLEIGLYYVSITVTATQASDFPGTNEYQLQVTGNDPSVLTAPGALASLARTDAPPPA